MSITKKCINNFVEKRLLSKNCHENEILINSDKRSRLLDPVEPKATKVKMFKVLEIFKYEITTEKTII